MLELAILTEPRAFGFLLLYCLVYVLPLHVYPAARASPHRSRDDPTAIRARIRAVSLSTAGCSLTTLVLLIRAGDTWHRMGYWPPGLLDIGASVALTALLFAAPLYERLLVDGYWNDLLSRKPLESLWSEWPTWRNLVAGPITEECLFRSAAIPLLVAAGTSLRSIIFLSPLVFGLAHVHHFYEFRVTHPDVSLFAAIARSVLQFSYTYLFGIYATFIFLRNGSLIAVILVHAFCNCMGLPRVWGLLEPHWLWRQSGPSIDRSVRLHTAIYYGLLLGGAWGWYKALYPWTQSPMALVEF